MKEFVVSELIWNRDGPLRPIRDMKVNVLRNGNILQEGEETYTGCVLFVIKLGVTAPLRSSYDSYYTSWPIFTVIFFHCAYVNLSQEFHLAIQSEDGTVQRA
jgi:hypothetical protein